MDLINSPMTLRQKSLVIKSLNYKDRRIKISQYCDEYKKDWTKFSFDEASNLTRTLDKMAWR